MEHLLSKLGHEFVIIGSRDNHNDCFRNPTRGTQHNNANEKKIISRKYFLKQWTNRKKLRLKGLDDDDDLAILHGDESGLLQLHDFLHDFRVLEVLAHGLQPKDTMIS